MRNKYTVGVIGAGRIGKIHIENLLRKIAGVNLKIVADININNELERWANEMGRFKLTTDTDELFDDPEIDVVVISSSTDTHTRFIQNAAKVKKHVFCEKPIDTDIKRIKKTLSIVEKSGIKLMVGFNRRFDRNFMRCHESIASGQIGDPHIVKITSRDPSPPPIEYIKVSGGMFLDMTI
ncbi:MAG: Gfo/Idh/MocA family oxidoreductase, partial [Promethearchaeota archaeon]